MMQNSELKALAWRRLWADGWFWRLFGGGLLLGLCSYAVQGFLKLGLVYLVVDDWQDYLEARMENSSDLTTIVPNLTKDYVMQATSASVLEFFFYLIIGGIASYGCAVILRRCLANDEPGWLGAAFGGFKDPFGMMWLNLCYCLIFLGYFFIGVGLPAFLFALAYPFFRSLSDLPMALGVGIGTAVVFVWAILMVMIPFYRYRFLFLVKADHPDWSASACLRACRQLMKGNMMRSFRLDCSYWGPILLPIFFVFLFVLCQALSSAFNDGLVLVSHLLAFLSWLALLAVIPTALVVSQYLSVGQGFLYEEIVGRSPRES